MPVPQKPTVHTQKPNNMNKLNNTVRLIGNLGYDPEVREVAKGRKVARISVATHESYTNQEGEKVTDTQWHTVVAWGRTAEMVQRLLRKGAPIALEGRLVHRSYTGKEGIKRYVTEIVLSDFKLIGPKREERIQEQEQLRVAA
jgi:single-strand DNA-binding protein